MSEGEDGGDFLSLVTSRIPAIGPQQREAEAGDNDIYTTVTGQRTADTLRFVRRTGKPFTMPYGLLPIVWGDYLPTMILIEYGGFFTVRLLGDGLEPLEVLIAERRVTRIRACDEATAARLPLAVTAIDILRHYPSREIGQSIAAAMVREMVDA